MKPRGRRYSTILEPVSGKAVPVYRGETLRISQVQGRQCVDFNAFNLHDYKEHMSVGHSRRQGFHLREGDVLMSNSPRFRPMLLITSMPASCETDTLAARCIAPLFEWRLGFEYHTNCQDTLAEAIREYDLTPDDVHDSFNIFMNTTWDGSGWWSEWNTAQQGDYVDLLACMDALCVPVTCGSGDVTFVGNFYLKPIEISVMEATSESRAQVDATESRLASRSRRLLESYRVKNIRVERELRANQSYEPDYARFPLYSESVEVPLTPGLEDLVQRLVDSGVPDNEADAIRRAFMVWYLAERGKKSPLEREWKVAGGPLDVMRETTVRDSTGAR